MPSETELKIMMSEYRELFDKYGDDERSVGWNLPKQEKRFDAITRPIRPLLLSPGCKVVDLGCGLGHLKTYFDRRGYQCQYRGVDVNHELIVAARRLREGEFSVGTEVPRFASPDIIIACGIFNRRFDDSHSFFLSSITRWIVEAKTTVIVSCLSACAKKKRPENYYISLSDVESTIDRNYVSGFTVDGDSLPGELVFHLNLVDRE